ncbi:SRPBCC domain-containing protein [Microbacteriaceae bacterium VKM Ac-2855]|nr:SRPBCC domain-containing protein [Microbacteriaceae bacterium VKM Ac-2855]
MSTVSTSESVIDEAAFSVRRTIHINASIEKVFRAVSEPASISQWFGQASFDGPEGTLTWEGRDPIPVRIEELDAPRLISFRWNNDDALGTSPTAVDEDNSTVFTFTLEEVHGGTQLTVVETGFETTSAPLANLEDHRQGWNSELDKLVALLSS